jgi:hypothetical protein
LNICSDEELENDGTNTDDGKLSFVLLLNKNFIEFIYHF